MYYTNHYVIDWDKVNNFEDLKKLFKAINISFEPNYSRLEEIKEYVKLEPKNTTSIGIIN